MTRLAIVNMDRHVLVNAEQRFKRAEEAANARYSEEQQPAEWSDVYWRTAFTPELVSLDERVEHADEQLARLKGQGYTVFLLASRPESMRAATEKWLNEHCVPYDVLVLKHPAFQYTKTIVWKAGIVHQLASAYRATEVLYVDSEQDHIAEVLKYPHAFALTCYSNLALKSEQTEEDENPF